MIGRALLFAVIAVVCGPVAHAAGDVLVCPAEDGEGAGAGAAREASPGGAVHTPGRDGARQQADRMRPVPHGRGCLRDGERGSGKVLFIDVRTRGELQFIGMPTLVDAHVPILIEATPPQWDDATSSFKLVPNPDFVAAVDGDSRRRV